MIIGIYGKTGVGKSTVCDYLSKKGFYVIDGDKLSRSILEKGTLCYNNVICAFGSDFLLENGCIDRRKLGNYVFQDALALEKLNSLMLPVIEDETIKLINENKGKNIIIDGAILYKTNLIKHCDKTILLKSNNSLERIVKRDNISEENAKKRINSQENFEKADIIIENNGSLTELYEKINVQLSKG